MLKFLVSVDNAPAIECVIEPRERGLKEGVLCEVALAGRFRTCLIQRIDKRAIYVRLLPAPRGLRLQL